MTTISVLKRTRADYAAKVKAIAAKEASLPEDQSLSDDETAEYNDLMARIDTLGERIERLEAADAKASETMTPEGDGEDDTEKAAPRAVVKAVPRRNVPQTSKALITPRKKGALMTRYVAGLVLAKSFGADMAINAMREYDDEVADVINKSLMSNAATGGQTFIPQAFSEDWIDLLRSKTVYDRISAPVFPLTNGNLTIPRLEATAGAGWGAEGTAITPADATLGNVTLASKKLTAAASYTRELMSRSPIGMENLVERDLIAASMRVLDLGLFTGSGTSGQPLGMATITPGTGISNRPVVADNTVDGATTTGSAALEGAVRYLRYMLAMMEGNNAEMISVFWSLHPVQKHYLASLKDGAGGFPLAAGLDAENPTLLGYPVFMSTQHPQNISGVVASGTLGSRIFLADAADIAKGEEGNVIVETSTEAGTSFYGHSVAVKVIRYVDLGYRRPQTVIVGRTNGWR